MNLKNYMNNINNMNNRASASTISTFYIITTCFASSIVENTPAPLATPFSVDSDRILLSDNKNSNININNPNIKYFYILVLRIWLCLFHPK